VATVLASSPLAKWWFWKEIARSIDRCVEDIPIYDHHYAAPGILRGGEYVQYQLLQLRKQGL